MDKLPNTAAPRWVVIVARRPRGPLVHAEVRALIDAKLLRMNDLACYASVTADEKTEWKFIWQFPEFDRRKGRDNVPHRSDGTLERRRQQSEETLKAELDAKIKILDPNDVPQDLRDIELVDLSLGSRMAYVPPQQIKEEDEESNYVAPSNEESGGSGKWLVGGVVVVVGLTYLGTSLMSGSSPSSSSSSKRTLTTTSSSSGAEIQGSLLSKKPIKKESITAPKRGAVDIPAADDPKFGTQPPALTRDGRDAEDLREERSRDDEREPAELPNEVSDNGEAPSTPNKMKKGTPRNIQEAAPSMEEGGDRAIGEIPPPEDD